MKKYQSFLSENFQFLEVKFSIYLNRRAFGNGYDRNVQNSPYVTCKQQKPR